MTVDTVHPDYNSAYKRWKLIRAIINNEAKHLIRTPDADDPVRSEQYKSDAILTNFTNLTKVGLTGLVFRQPPEIELPLEIDYLYDNINGGGINIYQFSQHLIGELLQLGRYGLLVDYHNDGQRAYIKPYNAEHIVNWKTKTVNGNCVLSLVVLKETVLKDSDDIFSQDMVVQYRALILTEENIYIQAIYDDNLNEVGMIIPADYNNKPFDKIPFIFVGSENNDWVVDYQPLYDLAVLNLGHYRNSADYEESVFICGQPYLVVNVGETSEEEFKEANPGGIKFGSRRALTLAAGGNASLLQANSNQLVAQAMNEKLAQAASIGARLIEAAGGRETAEAAKIRYGSQHSALYTLTSNASWAVEEALKLACLFMGANVEQVEYELNDQFYDETADPNLIAQEIMLLDRGVVSAEEIRANLKDAGVKLLDDTNLSALAEEINPLDGASDGIEE